MGRSGRSILVIGTADMSNKGASWERRFCVEFSRWFSRGKRDDLFWRTSGSGSRATHRARKGAVLTKYEYGDMKHECPQGRPFTDRFSVEMRSRARLNVLGVMYELDPSYSLISWWAKSTRDAERSRRVPVLVTHVTRGQSMLWAPGALFSVIEAGKLGLCLRQVAFSFPKGVPVRIEPGRKKESWYTFFENQWVRGVLLSEFFAKVDPRLLVQIRRADLPVPGARTVVASCA